MTGHTTRSPPGVHQTALWQNGKAERYNRTLQVEWAYREVFQHQRRPLHSPYSLARALQQSTATLSHRGKPPISRLSPT